MRAYIRVPLKDRFDEKVMPVSCGCWLWMGAANSLNYGDFWNGEALTRAHRYSYETLVADFPSEWFICHRCDNPACVNPAHLAPCTPKMNTADMVAKGRHKPAKKRGSRCRRGHEVTPQNTLANGGCKACRNQLYNERKLNGDPTI